MNDIERLDARVIRNSESGCWLWTGQINSSGYGVLSWRGKKRLAHRVNYELRIGSIPSGLELDHLCRKRSCVNPEHLEPVTRRVNLLRGETIIADQVKRTHCPKGHPYDAENTIIEGPRRQCRACRLVRMKRYHKEHPRDRTGYFRARYQRMRATEGGRLVQS
ncbi:MAG: HNH endonuclease signature motif containing protein [Acidiferrobacterales bacterium]